MDLGLRAPTHGRPAIHVHLDSPTITSSPRAMSAPSAEAGRMRAASERGSAIAMAVIVLVLLSMIAVAIVAASQRERSANRTRSDRMAGQSPIDIALSQYRFGLQSGKIKSSTSWIPNDSGLSSILTNFGGLTGKSIRNSELATYKDVDRSVPVDGRLTAEVDGVAGGLKQYWQVFKVEPPNAANQQQLIITIRAWVAASADSKDVTSARIVRAAFRQGRFSDYQLLTNGPIRLEDGVTVRGPIHSNGASDSKMRPPRPDDRIFAEAGARVVCPAADVDVSTAAGRINLPTCPQYNNQAPDENFVSFQGLTKSFRDMSELCGGVPVHCFIDNAVNKGPYTVDMRSDGQTAIVDQGTGAAAVLRTNVPNGGYIFNNSVSIRGIATQRMTIAAFANGRTDVSAPSITIVDNVGPAAGMSLGLFAQGDVVVNPRDADPDPAVFRCPTLVNAVLVAQTGSLSIGRQNMTDVAPVTQPTPCDRITIRGAIASTTSPVLSYRWPSRSWLLGFTERIYEWDASLRDNPPPFTPGTDRWDVSTYADADQSSLVGGVEPAS